MSDEEDDEDVDVDDDDDDDDDAKDEAEKENNVENVKQKKPVADNSSAKETGKKQVATRKSRKRIVAR